MRSRQFVRPGALIEGSVGRTVIERTRLARCDASVGDRPLRHRTNLEPMAGFEPTTCSLRKSCSTAELNGLIGLEPETGIEPATA